jgi:hypothetical protein
MGRKLRLDSYCYESLLFRKPGVEMSRIQKVVVYHEGVAICEDEFGKFLIEHANAKLTPLPEPRTCYLTEPKTPARSRKFEVELEVA